MVLIVGLTGGIASGKSLVRVMLNDLGCCTIDADDIAHEIIQPGGRAYQGIVDAFGTEIINSDKTINRLILGDIIFKDERKREKLNSIMHPIIIEEETCRLEKYCDQAEEGIGVVDAALMIEAGTYKHYDKLIVVFANEEQQIKRLVQRDSLSEEDALRRIKSQMAIEKKLKLADYKIDNSGSIKQTAAQVVEVYHSLKRDLEEKETLENKSD
jgi:dephospho-CoA kinase